MNKKNNKKYFKYIIILIILVVIDQICKIKIINLTEDIVLCNGMLVFTKIINTGMAFSMNQENNNINIVMTFVVFIIIINFIKNHYKNFDKRTEIALCMIFAGGIGNLIDRFFRGGVIDFIKIVNFPIFNIADILVFIGWILVITTTFRKIISNPKDEVKINNSKV